jgi:sigma-E factor negative regulatory protein RseC
MLEQTATVVDIEGDQLVLETRPQSTCQSCAVNKGCGTAVLAKSVGQKVIHFRVVNTLSVSKGDRVVLGLPENAVLKGSIVMYVMPLLMMLAVAFIADSVLAIDAERRDITIAMLSFASLALSIGIGRYLFRNAETSQSYTPVLLRKEPDIIVTGS